MADFFRTDIALFIFVVIILLTYDYGAALAPESLWVVILLGLFWGLCRLCFFFFPTLAKGAVYFVLTVGFVEAVLGLAQLYGFSPSGHPLFKTTGTFFNPGPYGGFIALMFPLVLHYWFRFRDKRRRYVFLFVGIVCILVFPATLSRTAWIAAFIGCTFVLIHNMRITDRLIRLFKNCRRATVLCAVFFCLLSGGAVYGIYRLKKDSADGRLFMWKMTIRAIKEAPLKGVGLGGFPAAYARSQMNYFDKAEACYLHSLSLLPERMYPYYLLTKLYADSADYQPEKMRRAAEAVLEKEAKIRSTAIDEMRDEVRTILKKKEEKDETK